VKELRRNMRIVGTLIILAFVVLCAGYALTVYTQGSQWASTSYNTRSAASNALRGDITDRSGNLLATTDEAGARVYLANEKARRALSQTVGDIRGMAGAGVETFHASTLMDISTSLMGRLSELISGTAHVGNSVQLTINAPLQAYVSSIFPSGYQGAVCIVNYKTGEILAMVSKPDYDPADVLGRQETQVADTAYLNRCLQGLYTPGSVFKIITAASALENDPSVTGQTFRCSGVWEFGNSKINCAGNTAHGQIDLKEAFAKSCNVTFGKLAYQLGGDRLRATAEKLGFNENFKFGDFIIYNAQYPEKTGSEADLVWSGVGQSTVLVTPLHMAMISGAVANGGVMMKPYLIGEVRAANGNLVVSGAPEAYRQVLSAEVAGTLASYMRAAVQSGTASKAAISGYTVCGKTGSAEVSDDKSVKTNAWYTGFVYDSAHPYAIAVVIEGAGAGGSQAAPLAADALKKAIELGN
jgi:peptidoglycan glycosyltransferase